MSDRKNIDRLFQEKFKDFEASPQKRVWKNIEKELQEKKRRPIIPFWYKLGGVAAAIALIFIAGNLFFNQASTPDKVVNGNSPEKLAPEQPNIVSPENNVFTQHDLPTTTKNNVASSSSKEEKPTNETENLYAESDLTKKITSPEKAEPSIVSSTKNDHVSTLASTEKKAVNEQQKYSSLVKVTPVEASTKKQQLAQHDFNTETTASKNLKESHRIVPKQANVASVQEKTNKAKEATILETEKKSAIAMEDSTVSSKKSLLTAAEELKKNQQDEENTTSDNQKSTPKWLISPTVSPIYYGSLSGNGSTIDKTLANNNAKGEVTMAYGVHFAYAISDKVKVRSGVSKVNMSYNTNDIAFGPSVEAVTLSSIDRTPTTETLEVTNTNTFSGRAVAPPSEVANNDISNFSTGTLNQQLGFIEVPLEIEYALLDKRFNINIIGGGSTLFLDKNNITIDSYQGKTDLGKANNLNNVSFTTNLGLGFGYELSKKIDVNLEPTFKYQLNTFSNNLNGFKPYYLGVYTGFSFKF